MTARRLWKNWFLERMITTTTARCIDRIRVTNAGVQRVLENWRKRLPDSSRRIEIENREAILLVDRDPDAGFAELIEAAWAGVRSRQW